MLSENKKEKVFKREFFRKVGKAIHDYELIQAGDKILVGVSGGKDSLALLEVLALRAKDPKQEYTVVAAHIDVENVEYEVDAKYLSEFCNRLEVKLVHSTIQVDMQKNEKKPACFVCSWHRRKKLFAIAKEEGCNKLALGHHRDDAVESLLMSMIFNSAMSSMPAKLEMFENSFTLIRPLIYLSNDETKQYSEIQNFKKQKKYCPYEKATNRGAMGKILEEMEKLSPQARNNIFASMHNIKNEYLP